MPLSAQEQAELSGLQTDPTLSPHLSPEEQAELHALQGGGSWLDTKLPFETTPRGMIQGTANSLPLAGGIAGGALGTMLELGGGTLVAAGLGGGIGSSLKNMIETGVLGKEKNREDSQQELRSGMSQGITGEGVGAATGPILSATGKMAYNSGIKPMLEAGEKYGVKDVGQFLRDNNIWGRAKSIANDAWDLAEKKLGSRNATLEQAGSAGGAPSMASAVKPTEDYIAELRATRDPYKVRAANDMEAQLADYKKLDASPAYSKVEPQKVVTGRTDYFEPTYGTQYVKTGDVPASRGVTPAEASGYKTSVSQEVNPKYRAQNAPALTPEVVKLNKTLAGGLQQETENSVSRALGPEAGLSLHADNADLSKLLTMSPVADRMAALEGRKNALTSVDAMIAGAGNPYMFALKKAADLAKTTGPRTSVGYGMTKAASSPWTPLLSNVGTQSAIQGAQ